ncbi:unnamed protein product [Discosporangium mesarthrocarpum]
MGRLVRIEVENFKSYAGAQIIGPFKDFTAVIGPNGAGKSNLMDAISFVLGVQSRHLRSQKLSDLVFRADGAITARRRAMVKVVYMVDGEEVDNLEGGEEIHFSRVITPAGASSYRLDGKEVAWEAYEKRLRQIGVLVKARNFLVFQGDVESIASKSPKELTQLFEQISGSDEFRAEYDELRKAKDVAEENTIFSFQKRKGYQVERKQQVKEQKEEAELFDQKLKELNSLRIESYLVQLFHIDKEVTEHQDDLELMREEMVEVQEREKAADAILKTTKRELAGLNRRLGQAESVLQEKQRGLQELGPRGVNLREGIKTLERQVSGE